jgi:hypothetical protein
VNLPGWRSRFSQRIVGLSGFVTTVISQVQGGIVESPMG